MKKFFCLFILFLLLPVAMQAQKEREIIPVDLKEGRKAAESRLHKKLTSEDPPYDFYEANADGIMLYYRYVEEDYCELVASPDGYTGVIRIPAFVTRRQIPVVGVGSLAFYNCKGVTEVILPTTMLYLESASFLECKDLQKVEVNDHLIAIGWNAFEGCWELTTINIPQSPLYNDKYFFYYPMMEYSSEGQTYVIPDGIEVINEGAFIFTMLHEVVIPNTVKVISDYAFDGSDIQRVTIPNSVEYIGTKAFGQTRIREVVVPSSVKYFGQKVFSTAWVLEKAVLENPLDSIPFETFASCFELKEVSYPETVHKLGDHSFHDCTSLTKLPDLSHIDSLGCFVFAGCRSLKSVALPPSISQVPSSTFLGCWELKDVRLPETIEDIGDFAFYQDTSLKSIRIPSSVRTIGYQAFAFCEQLKNVELSEGLLSIGSSAFSQLPELTSITLPKSLEKIGYAAFAFNEKLKDVYVLNPNPIERDCAVFDSYEHPLDMTLHVPAGSAERYANAPYWSNFNKIVEDVTGIELTQLDRDARRNARPVKRLIDGKVVIDTGSAGVIMTDGRRGIK